MNNKLKYYFENQGWFSKKPITVNDIKINLNISRINNKPRGAFWTSTIVDGETQWMDFCKNELEERYKDSKLYRVKLKNTDKIRILTLDLKGLIENRYDKYFTKPCIGNDDKEIADILTTLDYKKISHDYDVIHFPVNYGWSVYCSDIIKNPIHRHLYINVFNTMDCECSIFLNTNFIEDIIPYK